jgi:co-chaperonin GroES (HSP10)
MSKEPLSTSTQEVPKLKTALLDKIQAEKKPEKDLSNLGQETLERQQVGSNCGMVLKMGPHCYDKERYPEGPWCKKGDWVIFARYAGSRIQIDGGEVRLLNDDEILATIENPEDIFHQY